MPSSPLSPIKPLHAPTPAVATPVAGAVPPSRASVKRPDARIANLIAMMRARFSVIMIPSPEEERVMALLSGWAVKMKGGHMGRVKRWSLTEGLTDHPTKAGQIVQSDDATLSPDAALKAVLSTDPDANTIFVFRDLHHFMDNPEVLRLLRDCAHKLRGSKNGLILLQPRLQIPSDLEKEIAVADFPLPSSEELAAMLDQSFSEFVEGNPGLDGDLDGDVRTGAVRACSGLTETEANDAIAKAIIEAGGFKPAIVDSINRTKREAIRRTKCLEAIEADVSMDGVGGLGFMKTWLEKRSRCFTPEARAFGIGYPKGMLALGVPGGGKSLAARAVAHSYKLPLFRLDMGSVFGGVVGESEGNLRSALKIVEAVAPAVLWIDELEKGLSGVGSSDKSDGGTAARVFGTFLTWLQEKQAPVFCYFTANRINGLPPELLRKGRVDEIFFIDLPNDEERDQIIQIHLAKRGRDPKHFNTAMLATECPGFVGAEIETAIQEALIDAFSEGATDVSDSHIIAAFTKTVPLVKTQKDSLRDIFKFVAEGRAVRASAGTPVNLPDSFFNDALTTKF